MPFRDVIGHRQLVRLISQSVRRDSLPPSLIFSGPSGIGKRFIAVATGQVAQLHDADSAQPRLNVK